MQALRCACVDRHDEALLCHDICKSWNPTDHCLLEVLAEHCKSVAIRTATSSTNMNNCRYWWYTCSGLKAEPRPRLLLGLTHFANNHTDSKKQLLFKASAVIAKPHGPRKRPVLRINLTNTAHHEQQTHTSKQVPLVVQYAAACPSSRLNIAEE